MMNVLATVAWGGSMGIAVLFGAAPPTDWETIYTWGARLIIILAFIVGSTWRLSAGIHKKLTQIEDTQKSLQEKLNSLPCVQDAEQRAHPCPSKEHKL